jgi:hypothetical protein
MRIKVRLPHFLAGSRLIEMKFCTERGEMLSIAAASRMLTASFVGLFMPSMIRQESAQNVDRLL